MTNLPSHEDLVANILTTWSRASADDLTNGAEWYAYAHLYAHSLDRKRYKRAAGVIAALSPQTSWNENVKLATRAYSYSGPSGQTRANVDKVHAILKGHAPLDVLGGNKVRAFYACIVDPHASTEVVVDRHALSIAVGAEWIAENDHRWAKGWIQVLERKGAYEAIAEAYRAAAERLGVQPHQVQAITWLTCRQELRPKDSTFSRFEVEPACAECARIVSRCVCADKRDHSEDYF